MANVLSEDAKKQIGRLFRARFIMVGSLAAITGAFFAFLALLPGATGLYLQHLVSNEISATPPSIGAEDESERTEILRAQALVARPKGALIQEIRFVREKGKSTIALYGSAKDRTSVGLYRDALVKDPRFGDVAIPASALAGSEDGRFSITLTGTF